MNNYKDQLKDSELGYMLPQADNSLLNDVDAESAFQVIRSEDGIFRGTIMDVVRHLDLSGNLSFYETKIETEEGIYGLRLTAKENLKGFTPGIAWKVEDGQGNIITEIIYLLEIDFPSTITEGFGLTLDGRLIFIGSKRSAVLDSPDSLNGDYGMGHTTPWYVIGKILKWKMLSKLPDLKPHYFTPLRRD